MLEPFADGVAKEFDDAAGLCVRRMFGAVGIDCAAERDVAWHQFVLGVQPTAVCPFRRQRASV